MAFNLTINNPIGLSNINNTGGLLNLGDYVNMSNEIRLDSIISSACEQWEGKTYTSHFIYIKLIILWFVIIFIEGYWNPHIVMKYAIPNTKIKLVNQDFYLMTFVRNIIMLILFVKIIDVFAISEYYINKKSIGEILKGIIGS